MDKLLEPWLPALPPDPPIPCWLADKLRLFWHGDVKRPLSLPDMFLAHSRFGHPKSPHKVWDVNTGLWAGSLRILNGLKGEQ